MKRCENCKWWNEPTSGRIGSPRWTWLGRCDLFDSHYSQREHKDALAMANTENGFAWFDTSDEFGCIQWEAKEHNP